MTLFAQLVASIPNLDENIDPFVFAHVLAEGRGEFAPDALAVRGDDVEDLLWRSGQSWVVLGVWFQQKGNADDGGKGSKADGQSNHGVVSTIPRGD